MASDVPGPADPLARLAGVLAEAAGGARPTPLELAELLWLARQLEPAAQEPADPATRPERDAGDVPGKAPPRPSRPEPPAPAPVEGHPVPHPVPATPPALPRQPRVPLHLPAHGAGTGRPYTALRTPAPPMLRHPLKLQRALRPLKLLTDAPTGHRLDERATADRIARLGAAPEWWLPVLRPARERRLRLNLVHDTGPTMPVWRPLVRELHTALAQCGVFRAVTPARLEPDGTVHGGHASADGRTVVLIISDCMGPQWRPGPAGDRWAATLRLWSHRLPVAVVQPLPEHLWRDTALPAEPGLLTAPGPVAPTATLAFTPYDADPAPYAGHGAVPLPVLEPDPGWLGSWAGLVASPGGRAFPGSAAPLGRPPDPAARTDLARLSPEELVLRFRAVSSREAFRLAGHLALGRPDLPVMRLVQRAVEPDPRPQHLAEVILSGLLATVPGPPGSYAFRPGVRDLLLRSLPRSSRADTAGLLARAGALIEERAGSAPGEFRAVTPAAGGAEPAPADGPAFATVRPERARQLTGGRAMPAELVSGRYRLLERLTPTGTVWRAEDRAAHRTVAVRLHGAVTDAPRREAFVRAANHLKELRHPNVVTVHDAGVADDTPFVVMEYLDGIPLNAAAAPSGYRLPAPLAVSVGAQLARALGAVHAAGVTHGGLGMSRVVLLPDGRVKLSLFEPGRFDGQQGRTADLRALAELMLLLAVGTARVTQPFTAERMRHLPVPLRAHYAHALTLLMSSSPTEQEQGRLLLDSTEPRTRARSSYDRRRYRLLGPVAVELRGAEQPLGTTGRAMLAMLLLRDGRKVTQQELWTGLWAPGEPSRRVPDPDRLAAQVAATVGPGALARFPDGYALHTSSDSVDLRDCVELHSAAVKLAAEGELVRARDHLERALSLWYGDEPLAGVPGPAARAARPRLVQLRHTLCRKRAELDLELGEYDRAARDLTALLHSYPAREDYRRLLLIALRELGRLEEALEVFQEYELTGGVSPELLALGHELRRDHADSRDPGGPRPAATDPATTDPYPNDFGEEGPFPTEDDLPSVLHGPDDSPREAPLPQNEVPESLFTGEPATATSPPFRVEVLFEYADGPRDPDGLAALGRAVTRLLVAGRLDPGHYEMRALDEGYAVLLGSGTPVLPLLGVTLREFADRVAETGGPHWRVIFLAGDIEEEWPPPEGLADDVLVANGAQGIAVLSPSLYRELLAGGYNGPAPRALTPGGADDGWCVLAHTPRPETVSPVHGPFPLPSGLPLPEPVGRTRSVVYVTPGSGLTLVRDDTATFYYEVDLTERRTPVREPGPPIDGAPVFEAVGEVVWRITDPVTAVRPGAGRNASDLIAGHLRDCLRDISLTYPADYAHQARAAFHERLHGLSPAGHTARWTVSLTPVAAPRTAPPPMPGERRLAGALRAARAVLLCFDGTLARLGTDAGDLVHRYLPGSAGRSEDPLDLLRPAAPGSVSGAMEGELAARERTAAHRATPVADADLLVRTLAAKGMPLAVVTDCATDAVVTYLRRRGLMDCLPGGVHGRRGPDSALMPDPRAPLEAARRLGADPRDCLMIGSSDFERDAAESAGITFVYVDSVPLDVFAPSLLVSVELLPLLRAARTL
ncbi:SAV_2336 N-terminal domain-related protein [Streptomyces sp. NPDC005706]|uniref:SAV_2336 N-terminal domain-related protein n=1 Tax=Streptomyces sp. NPDC005706 TaxID=3157169 RepID=UPI00341084FD